MRAGRWLVPLAAVLLVLAGCGEPATDRLPTPTPVAVGTGDLQAQRKAAGLPDCPAATQTPSPGVPEITLPCIDGGAGGALNRVISGVTVINFWAQWCGPCRAEAPYLAQVSKEVSGTVTFLGVDQGDPRPELAIAFAAEAGWGYPQFADPDRVTRQPPFQVAALPATVVIDSSGKIVARHLGQLSSAEQLRQLIAKAS